MAGQVKTNVERDSNGTPNGASVSVKNDDWSWGGNAKTDAGQLYVQGSNLRTQVDYGPSGVSATLSATATSGDLSFKASVNSSGSMTGSGTAKIGDSSLTITPQDGALGFSHDFGDSSVSGRLTNDSAWSLTFKDSSNDSWGYSFSSGYNSSDGWSFGSYIFSTGL